MTYRHRLLVVLATAACALLAAAPGQAAPKKNAIDPQLALASTSTAAIGSQTESGPLETSLVAEESSLLAAAAACKWAQVSRWGNNIFGMRLWTYYQRIEWCYSNGLITSVTRLRWGEVSMPGWSFKGHTSSTTSGGKGSTSYRARTHGHFCLVEYFSCIQNAYPWIDMTVRGNGTWSYTAGG